MSRGWSRGARVGPALLLAFAVVLGAGCGGPGDDDGTGGGGSTTAEDPSDAAPGTDASLIPPDQVTSPTSGPPNTDPLAGATPPDPGVCEGREPGGPSAARALDLRVHLGETLETGRVRWALTLTNRGDRPVTLVYPTAQDADVVLRREGREAYRWSEGRAFATRERCQVIGAAQEYRVELRGTELDVEPGDYELVASWAADPSPGPARLEVTVVEPNAD